MDTVEVDHEIIVQIITVRISARKIPRVFRSICHAPSSLLLSGKHVSKRATVTTGRRQQSYIEQETACKSYHYYRISLNAVRIDRCN